MTRLLVHVEGTTEESFVNEVLRDHLRTFGFERVSARIVGNARNDSAAAESALGLQSATTSFAI